MLTFQSTYAFSDYGTQIQSGASTVEIARTSSYLVDSNGYSTGKFKAAEESAITRGATTENQNGSVDARVADTFLWATLYNSGGAATFLGAADSTYQGTTASKTASSSVRSELHGTVAQTSGSSGTWASSLTISSSTYTSQVTTASLTAITTTRSRVDYFSTTESSSTSFGSASYSSSWKTTASSVGSDSSSTTAASATESAYATVTLYTTGTLDASAWTCSVLAPRGNELLFQLTKTGSATVGSPEVLGVSTSVRKVLPDEMGRTVIVPAAVVSTSYALTQTTTSSTVASMTTTVESVGSLTSTIFDGNWPATGTSSYTAWLLTTSSTTITGKTTSSSAISISAPTVSAASLFSVWSSGLVPVTINDSTAGTVATSFHLAFTTTSSFAVYLSAVTPTSMSEVITGAPASFTSTTGTSTALTSLSTWSGNVQTTSTFTIEERLATSSGTEVCNENTASTQTTLSLWINTDGVTFLYRDSTFHTVFPPTAYSMVSSASTTGSCIETVAFTQTNSGTEQTSNSTFVFFQSTFHSPGLTTSGRTTSFFSSGPCGFSYTFDETLGRIGITNGNSTFETVTVLKHRATDHTLVGETRKTVGAYGTHTISEQTWITFSGGSTVHTISRETWYSSTYSQQINSQLGGTSVASYTSWNVTGTTEFTGYMEETSRTVSNSLLLFYVLGVTPETTAFDQGANLIKQAQRWPNVSAIVGIGRNGICAPNAHALSAALFDNLSASISFHYPFTTQGRRFEETQAAGFEEQTTRSTTYGHHALLLSTGATTYESGATSYSAAYRTIDSVLRLTTASTYSQSSTRVTAKGVGTGSSVTSSTASFAAILTTSSTHELTVSGVGSVARTNYRVVPWAKSTVQAVISGSTVRQFVSDVASQVFTGFDNSSSATVSGEPVRTWYNGRDFSTVGGAPGSPATIYFPPGAYSFTYETGNTTATSSFNLTAPTYSIVSGTFGLAIPDRQESAFEDRKFADTALQLSGLSTVCWPYSDPEDASRVSVRPVLTVSKFPAFE